jgi:hypothetical protein
MTGCLRRQVKGEAFCRYHLRELIEETSWQKRRHGMTSKLYTEDEVRQLLNDVGVGSLEQELRRLRLQLQRALGALHAAIDGGDACSDGVYYLETAGRTAWRLHKLTMAVWRAQLMERVARSRGERG